MCRPNRLSSAADVWYAVLFLHELVDDALLHAGLRPPRWMDELGLWLCAQYDSSL